jgi:hypothetical protein
MLGASAAIAQEGGTARRVGYMAIILAAVLAVAPAAAANIRPSPSPWRLSHALNRCARSKPTLA